MTQRIRVGTAGWTIPRAVAEAFPPDGAGLERYAARFDACEINSTFYRSHRSATYARWVERTPPGFRFSVKLSRAITHEAKLVDAEARLDAFVAEVRQLGDRLGPLLVQLPPSLALDAVSAERFFMALRERWPGDVACEPRHGAWFGEEAEALFIRYRIARVAADPAPHPAAAEPSGWPGFAYVRLHGSPRMYRSPYAPDRLDGIARTLLRSSARETWCVFDNTASGAAAADALALAERLR
jgi:uncharacterized protein YecE (DUF72 family)